VQSFPAANISGEYFSRTNFLFFGNRKSNWLVEDYAVVGKEGMISSLVP